MKTKRFSLVISVSIAVGIIFFLRDKISVKEIFDAKTWKGENPHMLLWGIVSFFVMLLAKSWRFFLFYQKAVKKKINRTEKIQLFHLFCFGYALSYFAAGIGAFIKIILLKKNHKIKAMTSMSLIGAEKIFSLAFVLPVIFYLSSIFYHNHQHSPQMFHYYLWLITFFLGSFILGLFFRKKIIFLCFAATKWLPKKWKKPVKKVVIYTNMGFSLIDNPLSLIICLALTGTIWLGEAGIFYSFFHFHGIKFTFSQSIIFFFVVFMHTILPITGSILTFELGFFHAAKVLNYDGNIWPTAIVTHTAIYALYLSTLIITTVLSHSLNREKKKEAREINLQGNSP